MLLGFGVVFKGTWMNNEVAIKEMIVSYDEVTLFFIFILLVQSYVSGIRISE
jgi:hypothetical protein